MSDATPTLAILGGGQLGRMLALSAIPLGVTVQSLDPVAGAPADAVSSLTVGALDDLGALRTTAAGADVVTFEWEGVPAAPLRTLVAEGRVVRPSVDALEVSQDRVDEKTTFRGSGSPSPTSRPSTHRPSSVPPSTPSARRRSSRPVEAATTARGRPRSRPPPMRPAPPRHCATVDR